MLKLESRNVAIWVEMGAGCGKLSRRTEFYVMTAMRWSMVGGERHSVVFCALEHIIELYRAR